MHTREAELLLSGPKSSKNLNIFRIATLKTVSSLRLELDASLFAIYEEADSCREQLENRKAMLGCVGNFGRGVSPVVGWIAILLFGVVPVCHAQTTGARQSLTPQQGKRSVTVEDAIRMTKLGELMYYRGASSRDAVAHFSPDGKEFVVVLRSGNLGKNTNDYSLLLWQTNEVFHSAVPRVLLTISSSSNQQAINSLTWLDNETVLFLGEHTGELQQLYAFKISTGRLERITNHRTNLLSYTMTPKGERVAYVAEEPKGAIFDQNSLRSGLHVATEGLADLLVGRKGVTALTGENGQLFLQDRQGSRQIATQGTIPASFRDVPHLSPDGKYLVVPFQPKVIPDSWQEYSDPFVHRLASQKAPSGGLSRYELIDIDTGDSRALLDAPIGLAGSEVVWLPDSRSVVISNTYLPIDNTDGEERKSRQSSANCVEVQVPSGEILKVSNGDAKLLGWDKKTKSLVFDPEREWWEALGSKPGAKVFIQKSEGRWVKVAGARSSDILPEIVLNEDMNSPPKIFAIDQITGRRSLLLDLNPSFEELKFGKVEEIHWKASDGHEVDGGLYYPVDYAPGKRYPLVIQTHAWNSAKFWIDGPWTTAFAAQSFAGKEMFVLQAEELSAQDVKDGNILGTLGEMTRATAAYEGAIDYLDQIGLINRDEVGVIGFSRTCLYVTYALTHSKYRFAAASITDGFDAGYFQYIAFGGEYARQIEEINGGLPFGNGLKLWKERSPAFNIDKVQAPVRIVALNPVSVLSEWGWFMALTRLGKPVDMMVLMDGEHILQKPWERMVSQGGNVDWFAFWLKGEEDPDPAKAEQYARWRELRKLQGKNEGAAAQSVSQ